MKKNNSGTSSGHSGTSCYRGSVTVGLAPTVRPISGDLAGLHGGTCSHTYRSTMRGSGEEAGVQA